MPGGYLFYGKDLPYNKLYHYNDYELIYYINDVTIDNEEVLVEYGANGTAAGTYEYGNERLSVEYANHAKEYYLYNGTGNVTQTTAQNGSLYLRYTYDPFGNITSIRAPFAVDTDDINRYTYNGEDYDYTTGLQYLRARYYDTSVGNFISQDTYLGDILNPLSQNRYTYCHNNPVMYDDPSGNEIIVVSGGMYNSDEDNEYQKEFIDTALLCIKNLDGTDETITWMIAEAGWTEEDISEFKELAEQYFPDVDINVEGFSDVSELIDHINCRTTDQGEEDLITGFYSFSHGFSEDSIVAYGYRYHVDYDVKETYLTIADIKKINSEAFSDDAISTFYSCNSAKLIYDSSIADEWYKATGSTTYAVDGKTDYLWSYGVPLSTLLKWKAQYLLGFGTDSSLKQRIDEAEAYRKTRKCLGIEQAYPAYCLPYLSKDSYDWYVVDENGRTVLEISGLPY